ncbi:MAG: Flp1 family type IVb pilin [Fusicatenibacter sp.]|nr:Flp1 family type IVb pilin [Lachnospiraceae bacterium]MDY2936934.1 Flp1 family type IVb pilin [Fusicatenibacter sp.]
MGRIPEFWQEEDAVGVVEVILILVVLIGLVLIFKKQLVSLVNNLLKKITEQSDSV